MLFHSNRNSFDSSSDSGVDMGADQDVESRYFTDDYIEVFSPTVFETVEVYTSNSENSEIDAYAMEGIDLGFETPLHNLEPGTYTLDVLEPSDFTKPTSPKKKEDFKRRCRRKPASKTAKDFLQTFSNQLEQTESKEVEDEKNLSWLLDFKVSSILNPVENVPENSDKQSKKKSNDIQKKPRYTYTELIEQALKENGELTVSGIYSWISSRYPYYQQNDDRWKNSVRHNLSINPQFRKGKKASQGAGHFWNINESATSASNIEVQNKKPVDVPKPSPVNALSSMEEELLMATRSIQNDTLLEFNDVNLHDAVMPISLSNELMKDPYINTTREDIERLWESTNNSTDTRFDSFSPLMDLADESAEIMNDDNFLINDIHNSICLGDELFSSGLNSPYYGLTI